MSNRRLRTLGFDAIVLQKLHKNNLLTCRDVLFKNELELLNLLNMNIFIIRNIIQKACDATVPSPTTALELWQSRETTSHLAFLPTFMVDLDIVLRGGLLAGSITEIAGPAGCGKTQFCLMMCVAAAMLHSHNTSCISGATIYIDTESAFSPYRLVEIAASRFPAKFSSEAAQKDLCSQVHIFTELTCSSLLSRLQKLEELIVTCDAKLVIIDSVASIVRKEFDSSINHNMAERSNFLARMAAILKHTAEAYSVPIITTNQIKAFISRSRFNMSDTSGMDNIVNSEFPTVCSSNVGAATVALGNTWSHCVNTRLIVQYVDDVARQILVAKSPLAPFASFIYFIGASGFVLQENSGSLYSGTDPGLQMIRTRSSVAHSFLAC